MMFTFVSCSALSSLRTVTWFISQHSTWLNSNYVLSNEHVFNSFLCSHCSPTSHLQLVPLGQEKMVQFQPSQVTAIILHVPLLSLSLWATYPGKNETSRLQTHSLLWSSQSIIWSRYQDPVYNEEINVLHRVAQLISSRVKVSIWIYLIFNSIRISIHSYAMHYDHGQSFLLSRINCQNENNNKNNVIWKHLLSSCSVAGTVLSPLNVFTQDFLTKTMRQVLLLSPFYREENWDKGRLNNLPKVICLGSRRARIQLRGSGSRNQPGLRGRFISGNFDFLL